MSTPRPRLLVRAAVSGGTLLALSAGALAAAAPASAHVTVNPREAAAGGYHKISVRVPNESPTAGTVKVAVALPSDTPLASVSVRPHVGWDAEVTRTALPEPVQSGDLELTEAVTRITWTAKPGVRVAPGQFEEFDISVGPLPEDVETLTFPATQTYDDGEVVAWDQPVVEGSEPEHPAPVLTVTGAPQGSHHTSATTASVAGAGGDTAAAEVDTTDTTARVLGAGGLAVGALGIGSAVATTLASRRRRAA